MTKNIKHNQVQNNNFTQYDFFIQGKKVRAFFPKPKADDKKIISNMQKILISTYLNDGKTVDKNKG